MVPRFYLKFAFALLSLSVFTLAKASKTVWCPIEFWTHMKVNHCKQISPGQMKCDVLITYVGYSLKPPATNTGDFPKSHIELGH